MDFHKVGHGYIVLIRDGAYVQAYTNDGVIVEQKSNTFKTVYIVAKRGILNQPRPTLENKKGD